VEGHVAYSMTSYEAHNDETLNLFEGERVYIIGEYFLKVRVFKKFRMAGNLKKYFYLGAVGQTKNIFKDYFFEMKRSRKLQNIVYFVWVIYSSWRRQNTKFVIFCVMNFILYRYLKLKKIILWVYKKTKTIFKWP
jgi:hypothetical protein